MRRTLGLLLLIISSFFLSACNPFESKVKAGLQVITNDISVSLFLDDQYLDKSPYINKNIKPGTYSLRIQPDDTDLATYETSVTLNKGLLTVVTWKPGKTPESSGGIIYEMEKLNDKSESEVFFSTIPDSTIISFDGQDKRFSPLELTQVEPGHHEFEITLPSYETQKHTINVVAGHRLNISIKLSKEEGGGNYIEQTAEENSTQAEIKSAEENDQLIDNKNGDLKSESEEGPLVGSKVKILPTNFFQEGQELLRVRDASSSAGKELGFVDVGQEYKYLQQTANNWYKIEFAPNQNGWISGRYSQLITE